MKKLYPHRKTIYESKTKKENGKGTVHDSEDKTISSTPMIK